MLATFLIYSLPYLHRHISQPIKHRYCTPTKHIITLEVHATRICHHLPLLVMSPMATNPYVVPEGLHSKLLSHLLPITTIILGKFRVKVRPKYHCLTASTLTPVTYFTLAFHCDALNSLYHQRLFKLKLQNLIIHSLLIPSS